MQPFSENGKMRLNQCIISGIEYTGTEIVGKHLCFPECSRKIVGKRLSEALFRLLNCYFRKKTKRNISFVERIREKEILETQQQ